MTDTIDSLSPGDEVYFLHGYDWEHGNVRSVNTKTITIEQDQMNGEVLRYRILKEKCAHPQEEIAVIWEMWRGVNGGGGYRVERTLYPQRRKPSNSWPRQGWLWEEKVDGQLVLSNHSDWTVDSPGGRPYNSDC